MLRTIEEFFSKEVTTLVSDAPEWKLINTFDRDQPNATQIIEQTTSQQTTNNQNNCVPVLSPNPITPIPNTACSPLSVEDSTAGSKKSCLVAKSRAEAILEKSRQSKTTTSVAKSNTSGGTTDVLEKAKAWGIEIWSLNKLFTWLDKFKSRSRLPIKRDGLTSACKQPNITQSANISSVNQDHTQAFKRQDNTYFTRGYATTVNLHSRSLSVDSVLEEAVETKWIASPFLKFEPVDNQNRPVYAEFRKFPRLYCYGKAGTSPFYSAPHQNSTTAGPCNNINQNKINSVTPTAASVNRQKSGLRRVFRETTKVNRVNPKTVNSISQPKATESAKSKLGACGDIKACSIQNKEKEKEKTVAHGRNQKLGYCEVCQINFCDLLQHINSAVHKDKVAVESTWKDLDDCMVMTNFHSQAGPIDELECSV